MTHESDKIKMEEYTTKGRMATITKIMQYAGTASITVVVGKNRLYILRGVKDSNISAAMDLDATVQVAHAQSLFHLVENILERMDKTDTSWIMSDLSTINEMYTNKRKPTKEVIEATIGEE